VTIERAGFPLPSPLGDPAMVEVALQEEYMKNIMSMMKQAQELQAKMSEMQAELENLQVEGVSGAGLVKVTLTGKGIMARLLIDRSLLKPDDAEILEDLIIAAHNDAKQKSEQAIAEKMQALTGGLPLPPGLKLF
jgi:DNA-binding YbaB/EbfC family protein